MKVEYIALSSSLEKLIPFKRLVELFLERCRTSIRQANFY